MEPINIPERYNYIACFMTLSCNLKCSYCLNEFGDFSYQRGHLSGDEWVAGLNRLISRPDLPVTIQGGEPSVHKDFLRVLEGLRADLNVDLLTNLQFDEEEFMKRIPPERLKRNAPYAPIRVSYHPEQMELAPLIKKTSKMLERGYGVGIWGVLHPAWEGKIYEAMEICRKAGIDFRLKEFLGEYQGRIYGTYKWPEAVSRKTRKNCLCRTSELIIGPTGHIYRCTADVYEGRTPIGHLLDPNFEIKGDFRPCGWYGYCNPCDIKLKTNRFQIFGHCSVEIVFPPEDDG